MLQRKLAEDLKDAMRKQDVPRRSVIRLVLAAVKNAEIAKLAPLDDSEVLGVISKEVKRHHESIEAFKQGNRSDLVAIEEAELAVLNTYLPRQMSRDEIIAEAKQVIQEVGAKGPADKGKVMSKLVAKLRGKAEGREINEVVTELLR